MPGVGIWLNDYFNIFGRLQHWKFAQSHSRFAKVDSSNCCPILKNKTVIKLTKTLTFCCTGEISPKLSTLLERCLTTFKIISAILYLKEKSVKSVCWDSVTRFSEILPLWQFFSSFFLFYKMLNLLWKICDIIGLIFIVAMATYWKIV